MTDDLSKQNHPLIEKLVGWNTASGKFITILLYLSFIVFMIGTIYKTAPYPHGDEGYYISMARNIRDYGIFNEMAKGNPVGFTIPLFLLTSLGIETRLAGQILSLLSTIAVFFGIRYISQKLFNLSGAYLQLALITVLLVISSVKDYWFAGSDNFYTAIFIWILIYLWKIVETWSPLKSFILAGVLMSVTALIRPLTLLLLVSSIGAMVFISFFNKAPAGKKVMAIIAFIVAFGLVFIVQQYPSLKETRTLAFERKIPDDTASYRRKIADTVKSNWTQRLALTNLLIEQGKKKLHKGPVYPSWVQTDEYIAKNGQGSLPGSALQVPAWNFHYFIKYLIKGILMVLYNFIRESGLIFVLPLIFLFRFSFKDYRKYSFFTIIMLIYTGIYIFLALNYVEPRDVFIPLLFTSVMGVALLKEMDFEAKKGVQVFAIIQFAVVLINLLLNVRYNLTHGGL